MSLLDGDRPLDVLHVVSFAAEHTVRNVGCELERHLGTEVLGGEGSTMITFPRPVRRANSRLARSSLHGRCGLLQRFAPFAPARVMIAPGETPSCSEAC